jgi:hypothetical protein
VGEGQWPLMTDASRALSHLWQVADMRGAGAAARVAARRVAGSQNDGEVTRPRTPPPSPHPSERTGLLASQQQTYFTDHIVHVPDAEAVSR